MKICQDEAKQSSVLGLFDAGDVVLIGDMTSPYIIHPNPDRARTHRVALTNLKTGNQALYPSSKRAVRYPNACLTLGEPE